MHRKILLGLDNFLVTSAVSSSHDDDSPSIGAGNVHFCGPLWGSQKAWQTHCPDAPAAATRLAAGARRRRSVSRTSALLSRSTASSTFPTTSCVKTQSEPEDSIHKIISLWMARSCLTPL